MPTVPPTISPLPTPPSRDDSVNFSTRADAFLGALPTFQSETNATSTNVYNNAVEVSNNATTVQSNTTLAVNSAASAAASVNASAWVSGNTYALGAVVWSPANGQIYRRIIAGAGTTDPSLDPTNWANVNSIVSSGGNNASLAGNFTVSGNATLEGNVTLGDAATDTVTINADVASNLIPSADNTYDLGASGSEWKDLYIDGTAYLDDVSADAVTVSSGSTLNGGVVVNELGADVDFRIESDTDANAFFLDGGTGSVGIGTSSPASSSGYAVLTLNNAVNGGSIIFQNNGSFKGSIYNSSSQFRVEAESSTPLVFANSTERMRIDSSGNVGIGLSSNIDRKLHVENDNDYAAKFGGTAGGDFAIEIGQAGINSSPGFNATSGSMKFSMAGSEAMRLTSDGELLVGGTTAIAGSSGFVTIEKENTNPGLLFFRKDTSVTTGNSLGSVQFYGNDTTSNTPTLHAYIDAVGSAVHAAGDNPTDIVFATTNDGTATAAEAGRITQGGSYVLKGGTTTLAAGVGIIFPATQVASANANSLDDYEKGSFTPTAVCTGQTITYTTQSGTYTKIGNIVRVQINIVINTVSGAAGGSTTISGLPFSNGDATYSGQAVIGYNDGFANTIYAAWISGTDMLFRSGTRGSGNDAGGFNAGGYISINAVYKV